MLVTLKKAYVERKDGWVVHWPAAEVEAPTHLVEVWEELGLLEGDEEPEFKVDEIASEDLSTPEPVDATEEDTDTEE